MGVIWVLVTVLGAGVTANFTRSVVRWFRGGATLWAYVGVGLTVYCLAKVPNIFNSAFDNVSGTDKVSLDYGGFLSLAAVLTMVIGITLFVRTLPAPAGTKICPACAEKVNAAADVCKHCGYRWGTALTAHP